MPIMVPTTIAAAAQPPSSRANPRCSLVWFVALVELPATIRAELESGLVDPKSAPQRRIAPSFQRVAVCVKFAVEAMWDKLVAEPCVRLSGPSTR